MSLVKLRDYQEKAVQELHNGSILCGGVGSGKSITAIAYYYKEQGGTYEPFTKLDPNKAKKLYIITTAKKRDSFEWNNDLANFLLSSHRDCSQVEVIIDSWNNIQEYKEVAGAFFIFDEQRVVGWGAWSKSFVRIAKCNDWILLSATPGDTWSDYIPVFVANGFYKNKTEFSREHIIMNYYGSFPRIDRYVGTGRLIRLRNNILVNMDYHKHTESHHIDIHTEYDSKMYKMALRHRINLETGEPFLNASELCGYLRKIVNRDKSRLDAILSLTAVNDRVIIFYNFDYELELLKSLDYGDNFEVAEWNGHKHQPIPESNKWVYLVQYNAGAEGWNCIKTNVIIFYSQNYSYKMMVQSSGRIDRLNSPYTDLYYYHLKSFSGIDLAIDKAIREKKKFNESRFAEM